MLPDGGRPFKVYPRAYGGTPENTVVRSPSTGLSPRIRGNHLGIGQFDRPQGSIPAHTGEPRIKRLRHIETRVYPRAYGGTKRRPASTAGTRGLSPRIRGNQSSNPRAGPGERSIPAHTGEPGPFQTRANQRRVYPRAYGGTQAALAPVAAGGGLSPRIRGNRDQHDCRFLRAGSIPAHTGEPSGGWFIPRSTRVYPRAYGGTILRALAYVVQAGLSPRIRGNLAALALRKGFDRSIPAHTGEPVDGHALPLATRVYPRAYGGTPRHQELDSLTMSNSRARGFSHVLRAKFRPRPQFPSVLRQGSRSGGNPPPSYPARP